MIYRHCSINTILITPLYFPSSHYYILQSYHSGGLEIQSGHKSVTFLEVSTSSSWWTWVPDNPRMDRSLTVSCCFALPKDNCIGVFFLRKRKYEHLIRPECPKELRYLPSVWLLRKLDAILKPGPMFLEGTRSQGSWCCHQHMASSIGKPLNSSHLAKP